jgi:hypothetical protein
MLFFPNDYLTNVCGWTNEVLAKRGHSSCTVKEFFAYMGLELGMSLIKYNSIKSYWARGCFLGHETFRDVCRLSISPGCDPVMGDNRAKQ